MRIGLNLKNWLAKHITTMLAMWLIVNVLFPCVIVLSDVLSCLMSHCNHPVSVVWDDLVLRVVIRLHI